MSDLMSDSELSVNKQVVCDVWPDHRHMSRAVMIVTLLATSVNNFPGHRSWGQIPAALIAHCSSNVLFSFRLVYYSEAAIMIRGEGSSHFGGIMSPTDVTDLFSIEHSARSRYMGSDLLSPGWSGPILSNPEWSQEIVGPSHSGSSTKNQHKTPSKRIWVNNGNDLRKYQSTTQAGDWIRD